MQTRPDSAGTPNSAQRASASSETVQLPTIEDLQADLIAQNERIEGLRRLRSLQQEEQELREAIHEEQVDIQRKRRRDTSDSSGTSGEIKVRNITQFPQFATLRRRDDWLGDLHRAFSGAPRRYASDRNKILLAQDNMDAECRTRWNRFLDEKSEKDRRSLENNWEAFEDWSITLIKDSTNREANVVLRLENAKQREYQSPIEFHNYLDSLEKHLPKATERERSLRFFAKLRDNLRNRILIEDPRIPETREEIVTIATTFWDVLQSESKRKYSNEPTYPRKRYIKKEYPRLPRVKDHHSPPNRQENEHLEKSHNPIGPGGKILRCYNCNSGEHLRPQCPRLPDIEQKGNRKRLQ